MNFDTKRIHFVLIIRKDTSFLEELKIEVTNNILTQFDFDINGIIQIIQIIAK